ncbi:thiol methyltransferase 1 [Vararia minispora EC-137]|uniref:Thiol methyltransferase 1 n=1 Tax=Vararia minispora EC-137 TaxID=1314806 RepID=A0ACB8Q5W4_9AGAM|nr:thiol methyltransferase 1 [Vararia minispora EC-137]
MPDLIAREGEDGWDVAWEKDITPWDAGAPQQSLVNVLKSGKLPFSTTGRALVPGCGRAYDAVAIASILGVQTTAIDISPLAVENAKKFVKTTAPDMEEKITIKQEDFFKLDETQPFDLIYDYTFFVALPHELRPAWAAKMTALARPNSYLITLMAPLGLPKTDIGPPYYSEPAHYDELLDGKGWEKALDEGPVNSTEGSRWPQKLVVWKRV